MLFISPSGLSRHRYVHESPRYPFMDRDKNFFFSYELRQHTTHQKVHEHFYNHGTCIIGFMNKADLLKHERTHINVAVKCSMCDYTTMNLRLMNSLSLMHRDKKLFKCEKCC